LPASKASYTSVIHRLGGLPSRQLAAPRRSAELSHIRAIALTKDWQTARAVDGIDFTAAAGRLVVLLGPSGCGKSTTLRLIAGLDAVTSGRIEIGGRDVTHLPPSERKVAMVFQNYALFPHLSVRDNILFGLSVRRVAKAEQRRRLVRTVELLGLGALLDRRPSQLSGGQQQRVALGRALVAETPVCLMDEPLSNLDAQLRQEMRREIRALQQRLGITMLYVTHDQTEAMSMADQVILMRGGRIEQDAPPAELYARPASIFAARFVGTPPMNILELADGASGAVIAGTAGPAVLAAAGQGLALGLRPEAVALAPGGGVPATVESVEYLGADSIIACRVGSQALALRVAGRTSAAAGEAVSLAWAQAATHIFALADGKRRDELAPRPRDFAPGFNNTLAPEEDTWTNA
jgi:sn-glycerol 3-phosphate transport system ATP-binding protein